MNHKNLIFLVCFTVSLELYTSNAQEPATIKDTYEKESKQELGSIKELGCLKSQQDDMSIEGLMQKIMLKMTNIEIALNKKMDDFDKRLTDLEYKVATRTENSQS